MFHLWKKLEAGKIDADLRRMLSVDMDVTVEAIRNVAIEHLRH